ncbi:hypothetical protein [Rosistilla oblonga]|uniref:hypothetical protein n=1 Tax=Rosistilla oblonga TaxID=2527990 RepID=UPI003A971FB9
MNYSVKCECGNLLIVRSSDAGSRRPCTCGNEVAVPPLSVLRQSPHIEAETDTPEKQTSHPLLVFGIALVGVFIVGFLSPPALMPLGWLMIFAGRFWFSIQILAEMALPNALLVFFVPFMPTVFLFKRFDIAWRPFLFGVFGIVVMLIGAAASAQ